MGCYNLYSRPTSMKYLIEDNMYTTILSVRRITQRRITKGENQIWNENVNEHRISKNMQKWIYDSKEELPQCVNKRQKKITDRIIEGRVAELECN